MKEAANPRPPRSVTAKIAAPDGKPASACAVSVNVGRTSGGGGVKVGSRVVEGSVWNAATSVGSKVAVARGVGVGGDSTIRSAPVRVTLAAYTHPTPPGQSANCIWTHSWAGVVPSAGAVA